MVCTISCSGTVVSQSSFTPSAKICGFSDFTFCHWSHACESGPRAGYDGYKRRRGSKVHMAVDTLGQLVALTVTPANEQERAQVKELCEAVQAATGESVKVAWADQGYTYLVFHDNWQTWEAGSNAHYGAHRPENEPHLRALMQTARARGMRIVFYVGLHNEQYTTTFNRSSGERYVAQRHPDRPLFTGQRHSGRTPTRLAHSAG